MSESLRRIYNSIDRRFDILAITQVWRYSRAGGDSRTPNTAQQAFHLVHPFVRELDWQPQLKKIVSQEGLTADGASTLWEFFFDLVRRRAQVVCEWVLPWDEATDDYGQANIEITINPFPAVNSPIREAIREGKLLYQQMIGMWKQECRRRPTLPNKFRDTEIVLADFVQQGLDTTQVEFSLSTGKSSQGQLCWIAQTRNTKYYSPFV